MYFPFLVLFYFWCTDFSSLEECFFSSDCPSVLGRLLYVNFVSCSYSLLSCSDPEHDPKLLDLPEIIFLHITKISIKCELLYIQPF